MKSLRQWWGFVITGSSTQLFSLSKCLLNVNISNCGSLTVSYVTNVLSVRWSMRSMRTLNWSGSVLRGVRENRPSQKVPGGSCSAQQRHISRHSQAVQNDENINRQVNQKPHVLIRRSIILIVNCLCLNVVYTFYRCSAATVVFPGKRGV